MILTIPQSKLRKRNLYASSYSSVDLVSLCGHVINIRSITVIILCCYYITLLYHSINYIYIDFPTHTDIYIYEQDRYISSLVVHKHRQRIQICHHNIMLKQIQDSAGDTAPIYITDDHNITSITNISTNSAYNKAHRPTYDNHYRPLRIQNE